MNRKTLKWIAVILLVAAFTLPFSAAAVAKGGKKAPALNPIIFVHGSSGSAAQFESQAMRFASNGYPAELITAYDYDTSVPLEVNEAEVYVGLDAHIAAVKADTGAEQVYILGHSRGTRVMHGYLAYPERADNVAKYVNIDGMSSTEPPGGVPTLSIIAGLGLGGEVGGAINVTIPGQTHVQVASSPESFYYMYQFFTGMEPATTDVIPQPRGQVRVAGRAVLFPQNVGVEGAMLQMWEVEAATGQRARKKPAASCVLGEDGSWGPWKAKGGSSYEFVILREGARPHHFYSEPLIRSDYLMRLNTSPPGGGVGAYLATGDGSTNLVLTRDKEFWANVPGNSDVLEVGGTTLVGEAGCPIGTSKVGIFVYDAPASIPPIPGTPDGISNITMPTWLHSIAFLTGIDFVIPAAIPPDSSVTVALTPRGGGPSQVVNCPNFASSEHAVSIRFNDFSQEINTWPEYKMAR